MRCPNVSSLVMVSILCCALVVGFAGCRKEEAEKAPANEPVAPAAAVVAVVNSACPVLGTKIDPEKIPAELTRTFKGQQVGFCCAGCPVAWDKLTDEEKQAKLDAAMAAK